MSPDHPAVAAEIASQPHVWAQAADLATTADVQEALPQRGERVALVGCGTSLYMARCCAVLRESAGHGDTDAFPASEYPAARHYDRVIALTRSGTTTEVLRRLERLAGTPTTVITTDRDHPVVGLATRAILLDFADEQSVVQTRFATAILALWRSWLGQDLTDARRDATNLLATAGDPELANAEQFTFLGSGWTVGLADEAALKLRESAQAWTESYPAMEFRHGPISVVDERSLVWVFGSIPDGLAGDVAATGARLVHRADLDPLAQLVEAQRLAVAVAQRRGLDPDRPRHLTRSIVLSDHGGTVGVPV